MLEERRCQCACECASNNGSARTGTHPRAHPGTDALSGHHDSGLVFVRNDDPAGQPVIPGPDAGAACVGKAPRVGQADAQAVRSAWKRAPGARFSLH